MTRHLVISIGEYGEIFLGSYSQYQENFGYLSENISVNDLMNIIYSDFHNCSVEIKEFDTEIETDYYIKNIIQESLK
jgi:hypothetical protein